MDPRIVTENNYIWGQGRFQLKKPSLGTCLVVQWLRIRDSNAGGMGLQRFIPGQRTKIPHACTMAGKKKGGVGKFLILIFHEILKEKILMLLMSVLGHQLLPCYIC